MNREALLELKRVLQTVPSDKLNMSLWAAGRLQCPSAACACGWAACDPWFQE